MASRLVVLRQRLAKSLHAAFAGFGEVVTPVIAERFAPFLAEGEPVFDFAQLQRVLQAMGEATFDAMVAADKAHLDELGNDVAPREERDEAVAGVRRKLIDVRQMLTGLFGGARTAEIVAVDGDTARQPELLWRQGEHTLSHLRDPELRLPEAKTDSIVFEPQKLAGELEPLVSRLRAAIDRTELDRRVAATTHKVKTEAIAEHDLLIGACARILSGFYLLARRPDLAARIRLSLPYASRPLPTEVEDEPVDSTGEDSTEDPDASPGEEPDGDVNTEA